MHYDRKKVVFQKDSCACGSVGSLVNRSNFYGGKVQQYGQQYPAYQRKKTIRERFLKHR